MKMRLNFFLFAAALIFWGCEKAVRFDLEEGEPRLVVEATIETGMGPVVVLSRSLDYFSEISPDLLAQSFVRNAEVFISDGATMQQLKEYNVPTGAGYFLYYYANDTTQPASAILGALKKAYTLKIVADGVTYTAQTTIPDTTRRIDSIWWKQVPQNVAKDEVTIYVRASDPKGFGDYIRYFTKKNSEAFYPPFNSVFDDNIIDGTTYELSVEPGFNKNIERNEDDYFFKRGDTVSMKLANIDKATFDFWRTMEYSYSSIGNPFATPVKVISNISGGALGYFGGYATQYFQIIIPK